MMRRFGLAALLALLLAACGTQPEVGSWLGSVTFHPEADAVDVPVDTDISVTYDFSQGDLEDAVLSFNVVAQETESAGLASAQVSGETMMDAEAGQVTFVPDAPLDHGTTYGVTVQGDVTLETGEELGGEAFWSFTTDEAEPGEPEEPDFGIAPPGDAGPIVIDDSGRGSPAENVANAGDVAIDVDIVCENEVGIVTDGFSLDPDTVDALSTEGVVVVADPSVQDGTYVCTITATDGTDTVEEIVTVIVDRTEGSGVVDGLGLPEDGALTLTIDDSSEGSADFTLTRVDGFDGNVTLAGECSQSGLQLESLTSPLQDPATDATLVVSLVDPENGLANGTYEGACEVTASADGSTDATTTVDVVVDRTIEGFQLPGSDGSGMTVTIDDANDPATQELSIARAEGFDADVSLIGSCSVSGLGVGFDPSSTTGDSSTMTVSADASVANGTYENACEVTGSAAGSEDSTTDVTVIVDRTVDGIDLGTLDGDDLVFTIDDTSGSDSETLEVTRENGFGGAVDVTGTCASEDGLAFDPLTIATDETTGDVTVTAAGDVRNGTYDCTLTASGEGSFDDELAATVEVDRSVDDFTLPAANAVTIQVGNDGTGSGTLTIDRDDVVSDAELNLEASNCDSGIALTFVDDPTTGDAELNVAVDGTLTNGTYHCDVTVTNPDTGESDTTTVEIVVEFDQFAFSSDPVSVSYEEGETHDDTLTIVRNSAHPEVDVDIAVTSCDAALTFSPTTGTLTGTDTDFSFTVSGGSAGNTYTCDAEGTSTRGEVEQLTFEVTVLEPATPTCSTLVDVVYDPTEYTYESGTGLVVEAPELVFENEPDCQEPDGVTYSVASYSPNSFTTFFELQADGTIHKIKSNKPQGNPLFEVTVAAEFDGTSVTSNLITIRAGEE